MYKKLLLLSLFAIILGCSEKNNLHVKNSNIYYKNSHVGKLSSSETEGIRTSDKVEAIDANTLKVTRTFTALETKDSVRLTLDLCHASKSNYSMIPSVCYNGNNWGRGKEPKGFSTDGVCHSYSYRRTAIPGATYSEGDKFVVAMWSDTPQNAKEAYSCSIMPDSTTVTHSLIIPEEERPFTYIDKNRYGKEFTQKLAMNKGDKIVLTAYIFVTEKGENGTHTARFLDKAWELAKKDYAKVIPADKVWEYGVKYAKESLWAEEESYKGFSIGMVPDGEQGWKQRPFGKYEIGWCGQNASFINSLLTDYLKNGNEESRDKAIAALDTWTAAEMQKENGFYITHYDYVMQKREKTVSDACNLGTAACNFFETATLLEKCNLSERVPHIKKVATSICDFVKADQQPSGIYGKGWNSDGECLYRDGTVGAFMIPAMIKAFEATGDKSYYESAIKAYNYYYGEFAKLGYTTAGALDTWCIDKESSISLLRAALSLYDITGDSTYIAKAERTSQYLSTWLWHYKDRYENESDITRYDYNTFGATSVSVQHNHLDVYALLWVSEWLRLAELTGRDIWREKALAIWTNGCQLISDGTLEINGRVRPVGGQNEAFFNCIWGYNGKSRINNWLVAWPGAFRLETLRKLPDWSVLDTAK